MAELAFIRSMMTITTTCNRLFNGFVVEGNYFDWTEKALAFILELYQKEEPARKKEEEERRRIEEERKLERARL
eukprot:CAMPEP_0170560860 /NCGR_PEP_ID=MMETSP0211-20121228/51468_1 /TAXON_ID=311385 /ORGANISM="Pseudokeronopsis sp., Strain OXSARD2" /LENGTH=73 /DNA_ID=CAMNT_0010875637 /DNA_START=157 /DNA_END=378 /DNA_ORIENTATION=-